MTLTSRLFSTFLEKITLEAIILFVDFDPIHRGKMKQILPAVGLPKEIVAAFMILYRNTTDGDTDYFGILAGVLQGDIFVPYLFIIRLDYVLRTSIDQMKENGFKLTKERSTWYLAQTIMVADNADDIALLVNAPAQVETLLHSLERAAVGIGLHVNAHKTEYHHHHHHIVLAARISLTLSRHSSLSFIAPGRSSGQQPVSSHSC